MNVRRLFLAFWPDEQQLEKLHHIQSEYAGFGKVVIPENFHVTLLFLGNISHQAADCIIESMQDVAVQPFDMRLDRLGYFQKTKIFWVGPSQTPDELERLYRNVRNYAQQCGISKLSKRYVPHVTLLRRCDIPVTNPDFSPIDWHVDEFHLVESRLDRDRARYYTVESFPFANLV